jgi:putative transcriptional regulator
MVKRQAFTLAALILSATLLRAAVPGPGAVPGSASLVGQLLIAAPQLEDPHFYHTVILVVRQDNDGAFGIVVNRPVAERSVASLLAAIGDKDTNYEGSVRIFSGGPVQPGVGFVVHDATYHRPETVAIDGHVAMTASPDVLRDIARKKGPAKALVAFGYAGWGPGQLEAEMAQHDWFIMPEDAKLTFDEDRDKVWEDAMARHSRDL